MSKVKRAMIVGAGLSGGVAARLLMDAGWTVTVYETRSGLGGNCRDEKTPHGVRHLYGAHAFHTNNQKVIDFVTRYAKWEPKLWHVRGKLEDGRTIHLPYIDSNDALMGRQVTDNWIMENIFVPYSERMWGMPFEKIPGSIWRRIKMRRPSGQRGYFEDRFQGLPVGGYTEFIGRLFKGAEIKYNQPARGWDDDRWLYDLTVYSGKADEFWEGVKPLPYRSLRMDWWTDQPLIGGLMATSECNREADHTRTIHHSAFDPSSRWYSRETPTDHIPGVNEPFYPMSAFSETLGLGKDIATISGLVRKEQSRDVMFLGRLGLYRYLDMDQAILLAIQRTERFLRLGSTAI